MPHSDQLNDFGNYLDFVETKRRHWQIVVSIVEFFLVIYLTTVIVNLPSYILRTKYLIDPKGIAEELAQKMKSKPTQGVVSSTSTTEGTSTATKTAEPVTPDTMTIEKIGVQAPIIWNVNSDQVQDTLQKGVVHIAGSSAPGTPGNTFLTGHSSDYFWDKGDFKAVFALLDKVKEGDEIKISYHGYDFKYKVYNTEVVSKDDLQRFISTDKKETLTLMTCSPVGTNWKRLMVQAERVQ